MDIIKLKNGVEIINDAYNASLESMKASLKDVVLFKASNGMQFYKIADEYQKYVEEN